ncbi:hypothetical protein JOF56_002435 [Kibdelosporangium banguiense]|uniref:Secreted protein n=1 Tax=Kibdelosporangium banguiense TaxID=1365924 RepID=A0ABS4TC95_9PSEU|nr:hypothetical protein [Kibdelosporangium banguiense]
MTALASLAVCAAISAGEVGFPWAGHHEMAWTNIAPRIVGVIEPVAAGRCRPLISPSSVRILSANQLPDFVLSSVP